MDITTVQETKTIRIHEKHFEPNDAVLDDIRLRYQAQGWRMSMMREETPYIYVEFVRYGI